MVGSYGAAVAVFILSLFGALPKDVFESSLDIASPSMIFPVTYHYLCPPHFKVIFPFLGLE